MKTYTDNVLTEIEKRYFPRMKDKYWSSEREKKSFFKSIFKQKLQQALDQQKEELVKKLEGEKRSGDEEIANDDWGQNYNEALDRAIEIIKES